MGQERRRSERYETQFKLIYDDGLDFNVGVVADLSSGGLFVETAVPPPVGTRVRLMPLDEGTEDLFDLEAEVVRIVGYEDTRLRPPGMGLRFRSLAEDIQRKVEAAASRLSRDRAGQTRDPFLGVFVPNAIKVGVATDERE